MDRYYELKMKHLVTLRTSLITVLMVLIGGLFGLHLLQLPTFAYWISLVVGFYYVGVFVFNLIKVNTEILDLIKETKNA